MSYKIKANQQIMKRVTLAIFEESDKEQSSSTMKQNTKCYETKAKEPKKTIPDSVNNKS